MENYYIITAVDRNGNVNGNDPALTYDVGDTITFDLSVLGGAHLSILELLWVACLLVVLVVREQIL